MFPRLLLGLAAALMVGWPAVAAPVHTLRLNESAGPDGPEAAALEVFKRDAEELSEGRLAIEIHYRDTLLATRQAIESLQTGTVDLYSGPLSAFRPLAPQELGALSVPYLIDTRGRLRRYLDSDVFAEATHKLLARGIRVLSTAGLRDPGRVIVANRPIRTADDLEGLRIRVGGDELAERSWRSVGAVPVRLGWNETYLALRRGTADAVTVPGGRLRSSNLIHVARYVAIEDAHPQVWPMAIAETAWRRLSPEDRDVLIDAADAAGRAYSRIAAEAAERDLESVVVRDHAVRIEVAALRRRMVPVYRRMVAEGLLAPEVLTPEVLTPEVLDATP